MFLSGFQNWNTEMRGNLPVPPKKDYSKGQGPFTESFPHSKAVLIVLKLHYLTRGKDGPFRPSIHSPFVYSYGTFPPLPIPGLQPSLI